MPIEYPPWTFFLWSPLLGLLLGWMLGKLTNWYTKNIQSNCLVVFYGPIVLVVMVWVFANAVVYATNTLSDKGLSFAWVILLLTEFVVAGVYPFVRELKKT
ncbi:TPA: hypothetical protein DCR79_00960 [Patescibacteria group bacterium]|nr:hypothetical protein [Patescibacteria group bacterium]